MGIEILSFAQLLGKETYFLKVLFSLDHVFLILPATVKYFFKPNSFFLKVRIIQMRLEDLNVNASRLSA